MEYEPFAPLGRPNATVALVETSAAAIAELAANLGAVLGVQKIVVGGSVGLSERYLETVSRFMSSEPTLFQIPFEKTALGNRSELVGALCR